MGKLLKKGISFLLAFCMFFSGVLPTGMSVAFAANGDAVTPKASYASVADVPSDYVGIIAVLTDHGAGHYTVDYTLRNTAGANGYGFALKWDKNVVTPVRNNGTTVITSYTSTTKKNLLTWGDIPEEWLNEDGKTEYAEENPGLVDGGIITADYDMVVGDIDNATITLDFFHATTLDPLFNNTDGTNKLAASTAANDVLIYSLHFKLNDSATLSPDTFSLWEYNTMPGAWVLDGGDEVTRDIVFAGFPQPAAATYPVDITVYQSDSKTPLNNATVVVNGETYTTNPDGKLLSGANIVSLEFEKGTYNWSIDPQNTSVATTHQQTNGNFEITGTESGTTAISLTCETRAMGTFPFDIVVLDGDNSNAALSGVSVNVAGTVVGSTDGSGKLTVEKQENAEAYKFTLSKEGYVDASGTVTVTVGGNGEIAITGSNMELTQKTDSANPVITVTMAKQQKLINVPVKDSNGDAVPGASVTVDADPADTTIPDSFKDKLPMTFRDDDGDGSVDLNLPAGDYDIVVSAPGFEASDKMDMTVAEDKVTIGGKDFELNTENKGTIELPADSNLTAVDGPLYVVTGTWDDKTNPTEMTVTVELQNMKAVYGTFGLRYDNRIFNLADFKINDDMNTGVVTTTSELIANAGGALSNPESDTTYGKHLFSWKGIGKNTDGVTEVDASAGKVLLATYTLSVKNNADGVRLSADEINALLNNESLFVVPIDETKYETWANKEYAWDTTLAEEFLVKFWRTADEDNVLQSGETELPEGRLDKSMATGRKGAEGFYQAFPVNNEADGEDFGAVIGYDVRTQITFPNPENNQRAEFIVTDDATGDLLPGATVKVYKDTATAADTATADELLFTLTTDANGEAFFSADLNTTYKYIVEKTGYWPYPGDLDNSKKNDLQTLEVKEDTVRENIALKAKIYHPVQLVINKEGVTPEEPATSQDAEISGEDKAYNGLDYSFNIQPKPGKEWAKDKPLTLDVVIKGANPDGSEDQTVEATFIPAKNAYVIPGDSITGDPIDPDTDPLKAGDLIIKITDDFFQDAQYTITAVAEGNGTITAPTAVTGTTDDDGKVVVEPGDKKVVETLAKGSSTSKEFVFTADSTPPADGQHYGVAKVIINGVDVSLGSDKGKTEYKYTFNDVVSDQTITVIFGKFTDEEPFEEIDPVYNPVVTVIGSEFGTITHDADAAKKGDRFDYTLTKTGDSYGEFDVTITPDSGYAIDKIVVDGTIIAIDGTDKALTDVKAVATSTSMGGASNDQVTGATLKLKDFGDTTNHNITATFKTIDGPSIQAIVTSSIKSGVGTVVPFGVSIYNLGDTPSYSMTAADKHQLGEVLFNDAKVDKDTDMTEAGGTYTYKLPALTGDSTLVVTFDEQAFEVHMKVQFFLDSESMIKPLRPADVVFVRQGDKKTYKFKTENMIDGVADVKAGIPVGTWDITVSKYGYLNYIITDYVVSADDVTADGYIKFGLETDDTTIRFIQLTIGEANHNGRLIALDDLAQVANGLLTGASNTAKQWADIDDSSTDLSAAEVNLDDIRYVKRHFGAAYTKKTYEEFMK